MNPSHPSNPPPDRLIDGYSPNGYSLLVLLCLKLVHLPAERRSLSRVNLFHPIVKPLHLNVKEIHRPAVKGNLKMNKKGN